MTRFWMNIPPIYGDRHPGKKNSCYQCTLVFVDFSYPCFDQSCQKWSWLLEIIDLWYFVQIGSGSPSAVFGFGGLNKKKSWSSSFKPDYSEFLCNLNSHKTLKSAAFRCSFHFIQAVPHWIWMQWSPNQRSGFKTWHGWILSRLVNCNSFPKY